MLRVCRKCTEGKVCVCVGCKDMLGSGWRREWGGVRLLQNILKSPLMNIKKAFGSQQLDYKCANQHNVSVCAGKGLRPDIN